MERQKKKQNGITLIALVISIIVMLILAGVSLNLTIGENGIVTKAQAAKIAHEDAVWNENAETILAEALMNKDNIEVLTEEEIASANGDESVIEELKAEKMRAYLYAKFCEASENPDNVIVSVVGEEFMIIDGERVFRVNKNFSEGIKVAAEKILVETNEDWLFTPIGTGYCKLSACTKELSGVVTIPAILVDKENKVAYEVVGIGDDVFNYATRVKGIDFSKVSTTLKTIGARAFANCSNLEITIPDSLPTSITEIGDQAFYNCKKLVGNINTIQNQGYTLGKGVFMKCPNLTGEIQSVFNQNFYLENNVPVATEIEEGQFNGFSGLTGTLIIPSYITSIGNNAFYGCSSIEGLYFEDTSYTVGSNVFTGTSASCTSIGNNCFANCTSLSNTIVIPLSMLSIGDSAFENCSSISGVLLTDKLTSIGANAFKNCSSLTGTVYLGKGLTSLGEYAFYITNVKKVDFSSEFKVTTIPEGCFYQSKIENITVGGNAYSYVENGVTKYASIFPSGIQILSSYSFRSNSGIGNIYLPDSITTIGTRCFMNSLNVSIIHWPNNLEEILGESFYGSKVSFLPTGSKLVKFGNSAFANCTYLPSIDIINYLKNSTITVLRNKCIHEL